MCGEGCSLVPEVPSTRRRRESKEKTCAERGVRRIERAPAHAKEGKVRKRRVPERGVRRIERAPAHVGEGKVRKRRVRKGVVADSRGVRHTPERKKKEVLKKIRKSDEIYNTTGNYSGSMCGKQ